MPEPNVTKPVDVSLPRVADGFRLLRELGRGGMGVVYHAEELSSGRVVALKVLGADQRVSEEAFERFRRESRMAASISDSRCVFVYGAHQVDGAPAISMELCPGETLEHRLAKREPIPVETAVRWTLEVLEGLEAAHRAGVVHRDVKPSNCFITQDDHVKVGDFGLSRSLDTDIRLTQSGAFLGSPLYASPEQIRGREVDLRSDIYSCGATLYALLCGRPPYHGQNIGEVLARILSEAPPPLSSLRAGLPTELEKVVARAMERDPQRRFQDHASFRAALDPFVAREVVPAGRPRRLVAYALDVVLVGAVSASIMFLSVAQDWHWADLDPARPGRLRSFTATVLLSALAPLYFALLEGLTGATPAKWMLGQRVVNARTLELDLGRCFLRALVFSAPAFLAVALLYSAQLSQQGYGLSIQAVTVANYLLQASTMRRRNGFRGLHELASGTRVVQARSPFARFKDQRPVPVHATQPADRWPAQVGSYGIESLIGPTRTGVLLQAVDQNLNRAVWIHARKDRAGECSESRRSLARPGRLRWLDSIHEGDTLYEAFEAPGGASLATCIAQGGSVDWSTAHRVLSGLAEEFAELSAHGSAGNPERTGDELASVCLEQVWVDRNWNPRLLDDPIGKGALECKPPLGLLADVARLMLRDGQHPDAVLPVWLPASADMVVRKLLGLAAPYSSVNEARRDLRSLADGPMSLSVSARALQMTASAIVPLLMLSATVIIMFALTGPIDAMQEALRSIRQLEAQDGDPAPAERMDDDDRRAREILISNTASNFFSGSSLGTVEPAQVEIRARAIEKYPSPSVEEIAWARERIRERPFHLQVPEASSAPGGAVEPAEAVETKLTPYAGVQVSGDDKRSIKELRWRIIPMFTLWTVGIWGILATVLAAIFRGGLSIRLFGIGVRDRRGEMASRRRCTWRSLLSWLPLLVPYGIAAWLAVEDHAMAGMTLTVLGLSLHVFGIAYAIWRPSRSMQDRWAGTYLVPR